MLGGDELPSAIAASETFADRPIPQLWDGSQLLGKAIARSLGTPEWTAWDIYLFYAPDATWTEQGPPPPEAMLAQAFGSVVGSPGTLPAVGDQSGLPAKLRDRVVIVGEQAELAALLGRVANQFAPRHALR